MASKVTINRAPVLTLWAVVVAERLGHDPEAALTLGKAVAGLNAQSKGRSLGIFGEAKEPAGAEGRAPAPGQEVQVPLLERLVPAVRTPQGLRATNKGQPVEPQSVRRYLQSRFGADLPEVRAALEALAASYPPEQLAARAYGLYERFRPAIPSGKAGWGAAGELDLDALRALASRR
jgi:hypothetical protein